MEAFSGVCGVDDDYYGAGDGRFCHGRHHCGHSQKTRSAIRRVASFLECFVVLGDRLKEDEVIALIETDKITVDVRYSESKPAKVAEVLVKEQQNVEVGQPIIKVRALLQSFPFGSRLGRIYRRRGSGIGRERKNHDGRRTQDFRRETKAISASTTQRTSQTQSAERNARATDASTKAIFASRNVCGSPLFR